MTNTQQHKLSLFILFILVVPFFIFIGFNKEYEVDTLLPMAYKGVLNGIPITTFYRYMIYWDTALVYLYKILPGFSWYDLLLVAYSFTIIIFFTYALYNVLRNLAKALRLIYMLLFLVLWSFSVFYLSFTRVPFFTCGVIWLIILIGFHGVDLKIKRVFLLFLCLIMTGATFIRYEGVLAALLLVSPTLLFIFYNKSRTEFRQTLFQLLFVFTPGFIGVIAHDISHNSQKDIIAKEFYQLHFNFFDANQKLQPYNKKDSIRLVAMNMDFCMDKDSLNLEKYKMLTTGHPLSIKSSQQLYLKFQAVLKDGFLMYQNSKYLIHLSLLLFFLSLMITCKDGNNFKILIFQQIWGWGGIFSIIFFLKYAERVSQPMIILQSISMLASLKYSKKSFFYLNNRMNQIFVGIILIFICIPLLKNYYFLGKELKENSKVNQQILGILSSIQKEDSRDIFFFDDVGLSMTSIFNEPKREQILVYSFDSFLSYFSEVEEGMTRYAGSISVIDLYSHIVHKANPPLIVASDRKLRMLKDYFKIIHNYNLEFIEVSNQYPDFTSINNRQERKLYYMSKFTPY